MPVVKGGQNLLPLVGIGLTDLQNIGEGAVLGPKKIEIIHTMYLHTHHIELLE